MRPLQLVHRSLLHYWRTNLAVVAGVGVAVAVLAGALLVGESVRASLLELAVGRLGRTDHLVASTQFFRRALVDDLTRQSGFASCCAAAYGLIAVDGLVTRPDSGGADGGKDGAKNGGSRAAGVAVYGIDEGFWAFHGRSSPGALRPREAWISPALARELGFADGGGGGDQGSVLVRLQQPSAIPLSTLQGRRDEAGKTIRVTVRGVLSAEAMGEFSLRPRQGDVRAIFLPIARLQADLNQPDRINAVLVSARDGTANASADAPALERLLAPSLQLEDAGLKTRALPGGSGFILDSDSGLLTDAIADVAQRTAATRQLRATPVLTYLAYAIRGGGREVPYSVVSAIDLDAAAAPATTSPAPTSPAPAASAPSAPAPAASAPSAPAPSAPAPPSPVSAVPAPAAPASAPPASAPSASTSPAPASPVSAAPAPPAPTAPAPSTTTAAPIWLNAWTADALQVKPGDSITLAYDVWEDAGGLVRGEAAFTLAGVLPMSGMGVDATLTPEYPGITGEESLSDWDPPFPLDLSRITPRDEDYWHRYRAAPKAFVRLADGQRLWGSRFGKVTSLRFASGDNATSPRPAAAASHGAPGGRRGNAETPTRAAAPSSAARVTSGDNSAESRRDAAPASMSSATSARADMAAGAGAAGPAPPGGARGDGDPAARALAASATSDDASGTRGLADYRDALKAALTPATAGFVVTPVRAAALTAAGGTTDFGEYFLYFSFFIVISGLLLAGLFFRLGVEQRVREVGLLEALGYRPALITRLFLIEGGYLAIAGSLLGVLGAMAYAALIMLGLRTWWVGAVGTTALTLKPSASALAIGAVAGVVTAVLAIALTLRGVTRVPARTLLHGDVAEAEANPDATQPDRPTNARASAGAAQVAAREARGARGAGARDAGGARGAVGARVGPIGERPGGRARRRRIWFGLSLVLAIALTIASALRLMDQTGGFFGAGGLALIAALLGLSIWLRRSPSPPTPAQTARGLWRFGQINAAARPGRTVLSVALIAFATFVIVTVGAFRQEGVASPDDPRSGTGGYALIAESVAPIVDDPDTPAGRATLGLDSPDVRSVLAGATIARFRVRPGDDGSCLNLYRPENPRIVAPTDAFVKRGGRFTFASTLAETDAERANPWLLLDRTFADGAVPAVVDQTSLMYVFHKSLGDVIVVPRGSGPPVTLRIVAALSHSIFQSELIVGEAAFVRLFPGNDGYRLFLVGVANGVSSGVNGGVDGGDASRIDAIGRMLENRLADFGVETTGTVDRLRAYQQVENTYLSTFQALGALGLVLGTFGVGTVLLRNILERRREIGLLQAIGYREGHVRGLILAESVALVVWGLVAGAACALLAVAPAIVEHGGRFPWTVLATLLVAVLAAGFVSSMAATALAVRLPLLASLRAE